MKCYNLTISVTGPLMIAGIEAIAHGVDAPFLRNHEGRIIIPGSQIRGVVRHVMRAMAAKSDRLPEEKADRLFGQVSATAGENADEAFESNSSAWEPRYGEIEFSDLVIEGREDRSSAMTRVAVDGFTGAVSHGSLQVLEQPIAVGETIDFSGYIEIQTKDGDEDEMADWVRKALILTPAIGAHKSAGFGKIERILLENGVETKTEYAVDEGVIAQIVRAGAAEVVLVFDAPFLVSSGRWNTNLFTGSPDVPGSVLKAAIAQSTGANETDSSLYQSLAGCVMAELRPAREDETRPMTPPLSLYYLETMGELLDAIDVSPSDWAEDGEMISFAMDWKEGSKPFELRSQSYPRSFDASYHVRTHTAINDSGTADTGKLFTFAAVEPKDFVWKGRISKGALNDDEFAELLRALPGRLLGIGKTRVSASLSIQPVEPISDRISGEVIMVLETDACLHTPNDLFAFGDEPAEEQLRLQYQAYLAGALRDRTGNSIVFSDEDLNLKFYASQRRLGGYLSARYAPTDDGYYPWLVTNAGSVFRFVVPEGCEVALESFVSCGLPVPAGFDTARKHWQGNPFVPENGFGEVRMSSAK
ncbi:CRISPR/Cas system CSM-associated protein Csm3, group 7 of RAMP superfamily [Cohaesibacter sp. ES.047]|uniref:RAMP superfamily CRISPR-associated protein n=1 Tax=Cohaesibacter sp. ES.047 TaxID=1798205 RepID=UPI000BB719A5|nr:RAMP superfamily CRISPR-associated protein [Cohaesibacter sp. ES.047]SNY91605.1 CRISPR/Cas system CSM-associated protein Csm3, group 7 of RAMP superfamily [Cohaesibacter sp. ES.047]